MPPVKARRAEDWRVKGGIYHSTLVVALGWACATTRVVEVRVPRFPPVVRGRLPPPTRGLDEWHPVGCFLTSRLLNKPKTTR